MRVPAICLLKSMTYTRCSQAIAWHSRAFAAPASNLEACTTIVPALPDFMAIHPELELEVSRTDRQVDLVQEGFDCVLRLGPIRDEALIVRPLGLLRMVSRQSAYWRAMVPSIAGRSPASGTSTIIFRRCWAQDPLDGDLRTEAATRRFSCQVRYTSTARRPTKPLPSPALG